MDDMYAMPVEENGKVNNGNLNANMRDICRRFGERMCHVAYTGLYTYKALKIRF